MRILSLLCFLLFSSSLMAEEPQVTWGRTDFPPFTILKGEDAGKGVTDQMIDFYIRHLPQYDHKKISGSLQRVLTNMQRGQAVCHGSLLWKKDRAEYVEYLEPNMAQFANGILTTKDKLPNFKAFLVGERLVDFNKLVQESSLRVRYHAERSYSPVIDQVIEAHANKSEVLLKKTGMKETVKELSLLLSGHFDGVIGRPEEGAYALRQLYSDQELVFLSIKGDKPYLMAQIGCAKGDWNDQFIRDVNAVTLKYRSSKEFAGFYAQWLPKDLRQRYLEMVPSLFAE